MGVIGSFCQLCLLPVQHDHYVPYEGMYKIFRGREASRSQDWGPDDHHVRFGPEHAWLADAVAITHDSRAVAGIAEDGVLDAGDEQVFIGDGQDEAVAFHRYCWQLSGMPQTFSTLVLGAGYLATARVQVYEGQLFEMQELIAHGKGWMLVDPRGDTADAQRSRDRISAIIDEAQAHTRRRNHRRITEVLEDDWDWRGTMVRGEGHVARAAIHYRISPNPEFEDLAEFPHLVWAMKEYGKEGMPSPAVFDELETFETELKRAVEANARAILMVSTFGEGQAQYLVQARDEAETCNAIRALPQGSTTLELDNETDPAWRMTFRMRPPA